MADLVASSAVLTVEQVRAMDADLIAQGHGFSTMQKAANALFHKVVELLDSGEWKIPLSLRPPVRTTFPSGWNMRPVVILAGKGNNGGDGILLAIKLREAKRSIRLLLLEAPDKFQGDALKAWQLWQSAGGSSEPLSDSKVLDSITGNSCGLIVDALYGTGFRDRLTGLAADVVTRVRQSLCPVLSVDVPSGIKPSTDDNPDLCIKADWTLLLGYPRLDACCQYPGDWYGQWDFADLGYSDALLLQHAPGPQVRLLTFSQVAKLLPFRSQWGEKRSQGTVGLLAGSRGMTGAASLCAMSAMRSGAGMVHLASPSAEISVLASRLLEIVLHPQDSVNGSLLASALANVVSLFSRCNVGCVGPGLSTSNEVQLLVRQLCLESDIPLVIDADGLNAFKGYSAVLRGLKHIPILTPHEGEWDRLFRIPAGTGWARVDVLRSRATEFNCVIVLKGAPTLIGAPNGDVYVLPVANSGLAKAGSGDVLAGTITSMRAQGASELEAALLGTWIHARAGMLTVQTLGQRGALPSDLIEIIPQVLVDLERCHS